MGPSAVQNKSTILQLAKQVADIDKADFWGNLRELLLLYVSFDLAAAFSYFKSYQPVRIVDLTPSAERDRLHFTLLRGAYLIGPYYNNLISKHVASSFYPFHEIAPDAIKESEYYRVYYSEKKVVDEGMFLVQIEENRYVGVLIERKEPSSGFSYRDIQELNALAPLVEALVHQHYRTANSELHESSQRFDEHFSNAFNRFGSNILTPREKNIAHLILRGHSSKSGAKELDISPNTERVHRRRLYEKLGITSQQELFWMFIESLSGFDAEGESDPLESYLAKRAAAKS